MIGTSLDDYLQNVVVEVFSFQWVFSIGIKLAVDHCGRIVWYKYL